MNGIVQPAQADPLIEASTEASALRAIVPATWESLALLGLLTVAALLYGAEYYDVISWLVPVALITILGLAAIQMVRAAGAVGLTPLFGLRLSTLIFIGVGSLTDALTRYNGEGQVTLGYSPTDSELAKAQLIYIIGTLALLLGARFASLMATRPMPPVGGQLRFGRMQIGVAFILFGLLLRSTLEISASLNASLGSANSIIGLISSLTAVGIYIVTLRGLEIGSKAALALVAATLLYSLFLALLLQSKDALILALLMAGLGILAQRFSIWRVLLVLTVISVIFPTLQRATTTVRSYQMEAQGELGGGTLSQRLSYIGRYLEEGPTTLDDDNGGPIGRLNYVPFTAFVISAYDVGSRSDEIRNSAYGLIPRVIWPEKPSTTANGNELYLMMGGNGATQVAPTILGDAYWNFGWGMILLLFAVGAALFVASRLAAHFLVARDPILLIYVLFVLRIGLSVDRSLVSSVLLPFAISVVLLYLLRAGRQFMILPAPAAGLAPGRFG